jgi:Acetyltransferase (GNAT) family
VVNWSLNLQPNLKMTIQKIPNKFQIIDATRQVENEVRYIIEQWQKENHVICYAHVENDTIQSFVLLSKNPFDPLGKHTNSYVVDLVYTFQECRKKGLAMSLLKHIIHKKHEMTAFCSTHESIRLFHGAGFKLTRFEPVSLPMFRYPE